jgi:Flp pilus assembly protein TadG
MIHVMIHRSQFARTLWKRVVNFARNQRGLAAVEFALLLPLMVTLYLGTTEVSKGIIIDRKVTLTARTVADLVSQATNINNTGMSDILNASAAVMYPYSTNNLKVTVTSINIDGNNKATVQWSDSYNGTARAVGSTVSLPGAINTANTTVIWSEVQYAYKPTIGYVITGTMTLKDQLYMAPRLSTSVTRTAN